MKQLTITLLTFLALNSTAYALDLETQQYNVSVAQDTLNKAQAEFDAASEKVKLQQQRIAQEQATLKDLQKQQGAAKQDVAKAQENLDKQYKALDEAWKLK
jgi:peptidoglycan hydrolase CwlO-like protein